MKSLTRAEMILHPIRLRILLTVQSRNLTSSEIGNELADVPRPTLYRHINKLLEAGLIQVAETRRTNGSSERVYTAVEATLSAEDVRSASAEEHERWFTTYIGTLLSAYKRYLSGPFDLVDDKVTYFTSGAMLTDEEAAAFKEGLKKLVSEANEKGPGPGRRRRRIAAMCFPEPE
jgi:Predicted transcriptional regulator